MKTDAAERAIRRGLDLMAAFGNSREIAAQLHIPYLKLFIGVLASGWKNARQLAFMANGFKAIRLATEEGDREKGVLPVGQVMGLIRDEPTVKEVVERIVSEAKAIQRGWPVSCRPTTLRPHLVVLVDLLVVLGGLFGVRLDHPARVRILEKLAVVLVLDEEVHDVVGARPDLDQAGVADHFFDRKDVRVADAADDLHGEVADRPGGVRGEFFCLAHQPAGGGEPRIDGLPRGDGQRPGGVEGGDRIGHFEAHPLEVPDLLTEGLAPVGVAGGDLERGAGHPE